MIFLSYSWENKVIADAIDTRFRLTNTELKRDIRNLHYHDNLKNFMKTINISDYIIIVISERYLQSTNCMYEALACNAVNYKERIIPVVLRSSCIFTSEGKMKYVEYWNNKLIELAENISKLDINENEDAINDLCLYKDVKNNMYSFLSEISKYNNIVIENDFTDDDFKKVNSYIFNEKMETSELIGKVLNEKIINIDSDDIRFIDKLISFAFIKPPFEMNYDTFPVYSSTQAYVFNISETNGFSGLTKSDIDKGISLGLLDSSEKIIKNEKEWYFTPDSNLIIYKSCKQVYFHFLINTSLPVYTFTERGMKLLASIWNNENYKININAIQILQNILKERAIISISDYQVIDEDGMRYVKSENRKVVI